MSNASYIGMANSMPANLDTTCAASRLTIVIGRAMAGFPAKAGSSARADVGRCGRDLRAD
jgi:hypothetical protein